MKFSQMPYTRPDKDAVLAALADFTAQLNAAQSFAEADRVFIAEDRYAADMESEFTLASIRHSIDTRDEFYDAEADYADETLPLLQEGVMAWNTALTKSPFRAELEAKYGDLLFRNTELALKTFSPAIVEDMQKENALTTAYNKLVASAQIAFENGTYTAAQMEPFLHDADDARRRAAWEAVGQWFGGVGEELDRLYDELVQLRDAMGRKLGFGDYIGLGYARMTRNCYDRSDIERFREAVQKYVVPLADRLYREQAKRLGKSYPLDHADCALEFRSGNPVPAGSSEDILAAGRKFYHELSAETGVFIDHMLENELMDVLAKPGKEAGGYCTEIARYKTPFIFANFNGTQHDVEVVTHEAGHAFQVWTARDIVPASYHWPSMEACEVHSMSMEFFAWPWAEDFFGPDARKFRYSHLAAALTFIPYGTLVDHFQHVVYEKPDMTPAERHEAWKKLAGVYMPWLRYDESLPFFGEGRRWQKQQHIYNSPFYYIDYCLAQTMSLYFWAAIQSDREAAWQQYYAYTKLAGTKTFTELLAAAGLPSPFDGDTLRRVCEAAGEWLDGYDMTGIA